MDINKLTYLIIFMLIIKIIFSIRFLMQKIYFKFTLTAIVAAVLLLNYVLTNMVQVNITFSVIKNFQLYDKAIVYIITMLLLMYIIIYIIMQYRRIREKEFSIVFFCLDFIVNSLIVFKKYYNFFPLEYYYVFFPLGYYIVITIPMIIYLSFKYKKRK